MTGGATRYRSPGIGEKNPVADKGWQREFEDPIRLPDGRTLVTLRDAATYVTGLPKREAALPEWQAAIEVLILVADLGGPTMFARIGVILWRRKRDMGGRVLACFNP
jgi:hypothetical protein